MQETSIVLHMSVSVCVCVCVCVEEPFTDKETSRDIRVFVALHDCPFVLRSLYPRLLPKDTAIINRRAAIG